MINMPKKPFIIDIFIGVIAFFLFFLAIAIIGINPFGDRTIAYNDAFHQYLDFFLYYKNVLRGDDSFVYSLSAGLGQGNIGLFAYYLASPINLLMCFSDLDNILVFFNIIIAIKISLAAAFMSLFLRNRFKEELPFFLLLGFSLSYAFMNYDICQAQNIMWLDGVYLLPLILLGVYRVANGLGRQLLSITVAMSIIFNWYAGGINCIFSVAWFVMELLLIDNQSFIDLSTILKRTSKYILSGLTGLMLSMPVFLPTIIAMREGIGSFNLNLITNTFRGNVISALHKYSLGSISTFDAAALFTGSLVFIAMITTIINSRIRLKNRLTLCAMIIFCVLIYYWQPLFVVFSLLKSVGSMWYRYSYVSSFAFVFVAAYGFVSSGGQSNKYRFIKIGAATALALLTLNYLNPVCDTKMIYLTSASMITTGALCEFICVERKRKNWAILGICVLVCVESVYNTKVILNSLSLDGVHHMNLYNSEQSDQIRAIKNSQHDAFRVSQTSTMKLECGNTTAKYNESLAFGYWGISSYTSAVKKKPIIFLDKLGYCGNDGRKNVVNTSIVPVDSMLGVKYVASTYAINGYKKADYFPTVNTDNIYVQGEINDLGYFLKSGEKSVFMNPYAFPMAYSVASDITSESNYIGNPFDYTNKLYSILLGEKTEVYKKANMKLSDIMPSDDGGSHMTAYISNFPGDCPLYFCASGDNYAEAAINVKDYKQTYSRWFTPSVLNIPTDKDSVEIQIEGMALENLKEYYAYYCDLNVLKKAADTINEEKATFDVSDNQRVITCKTNNLNGGEHLIVSIPKEKGWRAFRNGKEVEINTFADALICIELEEGENLVELRYTLPGFIPGIGIFAIGLILLFAGEVRKQQSDNIERAV